MNKPLFLIIFFILTANNALGSTCYVSETGGVHPVGNDNNDCSSWAQAKRTIQNAINSFSGVTDDTIILDSEDDFRQYSTINTGGSAKTAGSITITSENQNPVKCFISGNPSGAVYSLFRSNKANVSVNVSGVTFKDHKIINNAPPILYSHGSSFTWTNVIVDNIDIAPSPGYQALSVIRISFSNSETIALTNVTFKNVDYTAGTVNYGNEGVVYSEQYLGHTLNVTNLVVQDVNVTYNSDYQLNGVFFPRSTVNFSGTNTFKNISITGTTSASYGIIKLKTDSSISGSMIFDNCDSTLEGGQIFGPMINTTNSLTINNIDLFEIKNCDISNQGYDYGLIAGLTDSSHLSVNGPNILIHDNNVPTVMGAIFSQAGGTADIYKIQVFNNVMYAGAGLFGDSWGDFSIRQSVIHDNTVLGQGGAVYAVINPSATQDYNLIIENNTIYGNNATTLGYTDGLYLANNDDTFSLIATITNNIIKNQADNKEVLTQTFSGDPFVSITDSDIWGGPAAITGKIDVYENNIDSINNQINISPSDQDGDLIDDDADNCPFISNTSQTDLDGDGAGLDCDQFPTNPLEWSDSDEDGVGDNADNCLNTMNPDQFDFNNNALGYACDIAEQTMLENYRGIPGDVSDAPHNKSLNISCKDCHSYTLWFSESPVNGSASSIISKIESICSQCHGFEQQFSHMKGHSRVNMGSNSNPLITSDWRQSCVDCHDPHLQPQLMAHYPDDQNNMYLVTATIGSAASFIIDQTNKTTSFDYTDKIINNVTFTDPATWQRKNDRLQANGLIAVINPDNRDNTYIVAAADGLRIQIKGFVDPVLAGTQFALMYGQNIKDSIAGQEIKFFDPNGDYDRMPGLCNTCHFDLNIKHHDRNGLKPAHYAGQNCTISACHNVTGGLKSPGL